MASEELRVMYLAADEVALVEEFQKLKTIWNSMEDASEEFSEPLETRFETSSSIARLSVFFKGREHFPESETDMPSLKDLREILKNDRTLKEKTKQLNTLMEKNVTSSEEVIKRLIETHPDRRDLEKLLYDS